MTPIICKYLYAYSIAEHAWRCIKAPTPQPDEWIPETRFSRGEFLDGDLMPMPTDMKSFIAQHRPN